MKTLSLPGREKPYLMAHRGNRVLCPENTLAAFMKAFDEGADILETDLHLSADGIFMCIHDATIDRTTDGSGEVSTKTLTELKKFSASNGFSQYQNERIPTLVELAGILPAGIAVALELKTDRFLEPEICQQLISELHAYEIFERTIVLSFSLPRLQAVKSFAPSIPMGWITMKKFSPHALPEVLGPFWPALFLNPFFVATAHKRGQLVCPLDPTPDARLWYYKLLGCDTVISDNPGATLRKLKRISFKKTNKG